MDPRELRCAPPPPLSGAGDGRPGAGLLPPALALTVAARVAAALAHLHWHGVIHRDVKARHGLPYLYIAIRPHAAGRYFSDFSCQILLFIHLYHFANRAAPIGTERQRFRCQVFNSVVYSMGPHAANALPQRANRQRRRIRPLLT